MHVQVNRSLFGVFDGIAEQVVQDLREPFDVRLNVGREIRGEGVGELQTHFLGAVPEGVYDAVHELDQIKGGLHAGRLAGGQFFQVEDVVHQAEEVPARELHVGKVSQLFFPAGVLVNQQVRQSEDGIERRTDFVAHDRQEFRLGLVGCFRGLLQLQDVADVAAVEVELSRIEVDDVEFAGAFLS